MDKFLEMQQLIRTKEVRFRMFPDTPEGHEARNLALAQAEEEKRRATEARKAEGSGMYGNPN